MNLSTPIRQVVRVLAIYAFTVLEILGFPRIPGEKAGRGREEE